MGFNWHNLLYGKAGQFSPVDRSVGLDYASSFLDNTRAEATYFHEVSHALLSGSTDFGLATEELYKYLPLLKNFSDADKKDVVKLLRGSQIFTQEGSATLMEVLMLRKRYGAKDAIKWAKENFHEDYYEWFSELEFVVNLGNKYRDFFIKKIPNLAMHTAIRRVIVENCLLDDPARLKSYLSKDSSKPDFRYRKLINLIKDRPYLVLKSPSDLSLLAGIEFHEDVDKDDVVKFLNYLISFTDIEYKYKPEQILENNEAVKVITKEVNDNIIVGNLNLDLEKSSSFVLRKDDLLFYSDTIDTVVLSFAPKDVLYKKELESLLGKDLTFTVIAICNDGTKYIAALDHGEVKDIINNDLRDKTLVVKWGLYDFGVDKIKRVDDVRSPNIVLYNNPKVLRDKLSIYSLNNKMKYFHILASEGSPLNTLIIREGDVLHFMSTFGNVKIDKIKEDFKNILVEGEFSELEDVKDHFNNISVLWMGLHNEVDWYTSALKGDYLYFKDGKKLK